MPSILYRYLFLELLKVMLLTTAVIVVVIAFGAAIKPLAENLLGPGGMAKYIALAMVPMLQFALPFAAGFAATIVLHRAVTDNEITAMACCGISYRRILLPVLTLGILLLAVMFVLVSFAVPRFWLFLRQLSYRDVTSVFVSQVEHGEAFSMPRGSIYADDVLEVAAPRESGAERRLRLSGVVAIELDNQGKSRTEFTSETATVDVYRRGRATWMKLAMSQATAFRASEGTVVSVPEALPDAVLVDSGFFQGPKFLSLPALLAMRDELDSRGEDFKHRVELELVLAKADAWRCLAEHLQQGGSVTFDDEGNRRRYEVEGGVVRGSGIDPRVSGGVVTITEYERGVASRRATSPRADLAVDDNTPPGAPLRFEVVLQDPKVTDLRSREPIRAKWPQRLISLEVHGCPGRDWATMGNEDAATMASEIPPDGPGPAADLSRLGAEAATALRGDVRATANEISSHLAQRAAQSASAPLILILGAVLAMWRRNSLPLAVYVLAFAPAVGNILLVASGQQLMRGGSLVAGSIVMWSGTAALLAIALFAYRRTARN